MHYLLRRIAPVLLVVIASASMAAAEDPPGAAIASAHELATGAGFEVLESGGNAFDAAVAVSAALAVVEPTSSGLGGGGFWLLHQGATGKDVFVDGREMAPAAATEDMYVRDGEVDRDLAVNGPLAAGIPGLPAGLVHLSEKYGRLSLARNLEPAIRLAQEGFPVYPKFHRMLEWRAEVMQRWEAAPAVFLPEGDVPALGTMIRQPDLAVTLRELADEGRSGYYGGDVADRLVKGVRDAGGIWTHEDLANYKVVEREPVRFTYRDDMEVITSPPPSSGGAALATMLNILENYDLERLDAVKRHHVVIEAMRRAYRDRTIYLGDSDFVDVPMDRLTSDYYADGLRAGIRMDKATPSSMLPGIESETEGSDTTHFSVIDSEGNRVAATLTVNLPFGSAFMPPGTGVLLNNEMDDFSAKPGVPNAYGLLGASANAIAPGKRPLSSMSPSFAIHGDRIAVLGTPGGSRIITMVLLGLLDFYDGNGPESWVSKPRYHHQYLPDRVSCEPKACPPAIAEGLRALGHELEQRDDEWGNMHGVMWNRASGALEAGSDPRVSVGHAEVRYDEERPAAASD